MRADLIYPDESYAIMGACSAVYKDKGWGFLEPVYQECLEIEFKHQNIPHVARKSLTLTYRGRTLRHTYEPDFICYDKIFVELRRALIDQCYRDILVELKTREIKDAFNEAMDKAAVLADEIAAKIEKTVRIWLGEETGSDAAAPSNQPADAAPSP